MTKPHCILIFGANGSGKSTLGRMLAGKLNYKYMDVEDYYFPPSDIPYSVSRTKEEVIKLMLADTEKHPCFVLSAVTGDFGNEIMSKFDLAVWLSAPRGIRIDRIRQRAVDKFGDRVLEGGDMYVSNRKFIDFAANRPLDTIDAFREKLTCPVITLDGTKPACQLSDEALSFIGNNEV